MKINILPVPVRSQTFTGTGRFMAGLFTFLTRWLIANQFRVRASGRNRFRTIITTVKKLIKSQGFCILFHDIMLSCEMWSVLHANESWETSNVARNWHGQWSTTDLIWCHPLWPGNCQSWYILTTDFTPQHQRNRDWVGEKMLKVKAFNSNTFCHIYLDIFAHSKCIGFKQLCQRDLFCFFFKCSFSTYLWPLLHG